MSLPQPAYFTGKGVDAIPEGRPVLVLPFTSPGLRWNEPVLWQALAGLRFTMREGYFLMSNGHGPAFQTCGTTWVRPRRARRRDRAGSARSGGDRGDRRTERIPSVASAGTQLRARL